MDTLEARAEFDRLADSFALMLKARNAAEKAAEAFRRRVTEAAASNGAGLPAIDVALASQRDTLRDLISAALQFPPIDGRDLFALRDMLIRSIDLLGPADDGTTRLAKALADALKPAEATQPAS